MAEQQRTPYPSRWLLMGKFEKMQFYLSLGYNCFEIAEKLNVHRVTISRWKKELREMYVRKKPEVIDKLKKRRTRGKNDAD
jgi:transposase